MGRLARSGLFRVLAWILCAVLLLALILYATKPDEEKLQTLLAELTANDPGWTWSALQAARESIPPDENAALFFQQIKISQPTFTSDLGWTVQPNRPPNRLISLANEHILDSLLQVDPETLRLSLQLDRFSRGRFPDRNLGFSVADPSSSPFASDGSSLTNPAQPVEQLLDYEAFRQANRNQARAALRATLAVLNTATIFGDEPLLISQAYRAHQQQRAVAILERTLALTTEPTVSDLLRMEAALQREIRHLGLRIALRGERAASFERMRFALKVFQKFSATSIELDYQPSDSLARRLFEWWVLRRLKADQAPFIRYLNRLAALADAQPAEQLAGIAVLESERKSRGTLAGLVVPPLESSVQMILASQTRLRLALLACVCERYRLQHQRWPSRWADLTPSWLPAPLTHAVTGNPLVLQPDAEGLRLRASSNKDELLVFQLWSLEHRRLPPPADEQDPKPKPAIPIQSAL